MLYYLALPLSQFWGPFRLLRSYLVLISLGTACTALAVWWLLPRLEEFLPRDRGKRLAPHGERSRGKPTGAGLVFTLLLVPILALVLPFSPRTWGGLGCLLLAMFTGFLDDAAPVPWGEYKKGALDLLVAGGTAFVLCGGAPTPIWLPLVKTSFLAPAWVYVPMATVVLWAAINATNCSDGVDGLAGSLTLLSLFYLGALLYGVVGHAGIARYLLIPHNPEGARWAVLVFSAAGGLGGYLWHNAEPSRLLMGDAGSRFLGLLVGIAVLAAGGPFLILVVAPVVLANGGTGIVKILLLRGFRKLGFDVTPPHRAAPGLGRPPQHVLVRMLHSVRFPLHDHCRNNLGWSNAQVLMRFVLIQAFVTPLLLVLLLKVR